MNRQLLAVALLAAASAAMAQNSPGPNPFARPAASTTAATPGSPAGPAAGGAAANAPATMPPGIVNNGMPTPVMPQPLGPGANGVPNAVNGMPAFQAPGVPGQPGSGVLEPTEEEVQVVRVGKVNGQYIYRGNATYLFEATAKKKYVRKPVVQAPSATAGLPAIPVPGGASPASTANLPSMVGRPAPTTK